MRLIDVDALTKRLIEFCNKNCPYTAKARDIMCGSCFMGLALETVEDAPTIEPERKSGHWIIYTVSMLDGEDCKCSECGQTSCAPYWNFCPNCGAKMEGVRSDGSD